MTAPSLRAMTMADLNSVVKIHQQAFQGFFLEQMGTSFLKTYYRIVLAYSGSVAHVYVGKGGFVEGFAVGFLAPKAFYEELKTSRTQLFLPLFLGVIRNPNLCIKIFENIKRVSNSESVNSKILEDKDTAELSSIAVGSAAKGIGSLLIDAFIKDVWSREIENITLTTDYEDNELVNNFYLKHGFTRCGVDVRKGRKLWRYILTKG